MYLLTIQFIYFFNIDLFKSQYFPLSIYIFSIKKDKFIHIYTYIYIYIYIYIYETKGYGLSTLQSLQLSTPRQSDALLTLKRSSQLLPTTNTFYFLLSIFLLFLSHFQFLSYKVARSLSRYHVSPQSFEQPDLKKVHLHLLTLSFAF